MSLTSFDRHNHRFVLSPILLLCFLFLSFLLYYFVSLSLGVNTKFKTIDLSEKEKADAVPSSFTLFENKSNLLILPEWIGSSVIRFKDHQC